MSSTFDYPTLNAFLAEHGEALAGLRRRDDIARLLKPGGIGVELGVAEGRFSAKILARSRLSFLYSIDMWSGDRGPDVEEYKKALRNLEPFRERNGALRLRFDEALDLFPDGYFDFVYVDGYAHTGEEGGRTFRDWWPKCRSGGIFGGDDYHETFPLVVQAVDAFLEQHGCPRYVIEPLEPAEDWASHYPTWFTVKP
ncbi:class I SAM-dependent methyltransferase [Brevundimonas sp. 2R-24]|uniref:Class I SAM-dependent methyltransferase n=1 Tax=Peiella sedimenti TaxID=3061083 RepID=A0ABT8SMF1_9CAUL|nr:class I SAM-dependent methyltransferase [Caulobacteraceae bacterium XZ-24]